MSIKPRRVLISLPYWRSVTVVCQSDMIERLLACGWRVVISAPQPAVVRLRHRFGGDSRVVISGHLPDPLAFFWLRKGMELFALNVLFFVHERATFRALLGQIIPLARAASRMRFWPSRGILICARVAVIVAALACGALLKVFCRTGLADQVLLRQRIGSISLRIYRGLVAFPWGGFLRKGGFSVCCLTRMFESPEEHALWEACRRARIPVVGVCVHLDGLNRKTDYCWVGFPPVEKMCLWSDDLKEVFCRTYQFAPAAVAVTGYPQHDAYHALLSHNALTGRHEVLRSRGLDPDRRLLVFCMPVICDWQLEPTRVFFERFRCALSSGGFSRSCQLYVRFHPDAPPWYCDWVRRNCARDRWIIYEPADLVADDDPRPFLSLLRHADVFLAGRSGSVIDALICGTPVVCKLYPDIEPPQYEDTGVMRAGDVFQSFIRYSGAVRDAHTFNDLVAAVNAYLDDRSLDGHARAELVRRLCGRLDGGAGDRICALINGYG